MNTENMSEEEVVEAILEALDEDGRINQDYVDISCVKGLITVNGRVSSEEELQALDEILGDVLELTKYKNNVWVDDTLDFDAKKEDDDDDDMKSLKFDDEDNDIDDRDYSEDEDDEYK